MNPDFLLPEPQIIMIYMMHSDKTSCSSGTSGLSAVQTVFHPGQSVNPENPGSDGLYCHETTGIFLRKDCPQSFV
jgi:hypothetical protein